MFLIRRKEYSFTSHYYYAIIPCSFYYFSHDKWKVKNWCDLCTNMSQKVWYQFPALFLSWRVLVFFFCIVFRCLHDQPQRDVACSDDGKDDDDNDQNVVVADAIGKTVQLAACLDLVQCSWIVANLSWKTISLLLAATPVEIVLVSSLEVDSLRRCRHPSNPNWKNDP